MESKKNSCPTATTSWIISLQACVAANETSPVAFIDQLPAGRNNRINAVVTGGCEGVIQEPYVRSGSAKCIKTQTAFHDSAG